MIVKRGKVKIHRVFEDEELNEKTKKAMDEVKKDIIEKNDKDERLNTDKKTN